MTRVTKLDYRSARELAKLPPEQTGAGLPIGRIPGQIVRNILYYFTGPNALVVDPLWRKRRYAGRLPPHGKALSDIRSSAQQG